MGTKASGRKVVQSDFGGVEVLEVAEERRPVPGVGEVLVQVRAAGLNPVDAKSRDHAELPGQVPPFTLGWDVSGVVEEVGLGVAFHKVGDEVFGMPRFPEFAEAHGDYVVAPARHLAKKPESLSHVEAGALPLAGLTARQALVDFADVRAGQRVLIHAAAGGVGHLAVQIAKARGAHVIATASAPKHAMLKELGVDEAVDYREVDFSQVVSDVNVVLDPLGGDCARRSAKVVADGGIVVSIKRGMEALDREDEGRVRHGFMIVEPDLGGLRDIAEMVEAGSLRPVVSGVFALEKAAEAHRAVDSGSTVGKLVFDLEK